jgi:hypothetical protein
MARGLVVRLAAGALTRVSASVAAATTEQLPVGAAQGVRIVREHGAITVVFTPRAVRLWRRVAGKRVGVLCKSGPSEPDRNGIVSSEGAEPRSAPRGAAGGSAPATSPAGWMSARYGSRRAP